MLKVIRKAKMASTGPHFRKSDIESSSSKLNGIIGVAD
jgi:hypothetical protein